MLLNAGIQNIPSPMNCSYYGNRCFYVGFPNFVILKYSQQMHDLWNYDISSLVEGNLQACEKGPQKP